MEYKTHAHPIGRSMSRATEPSMGLQLAFVTLYPLWTFSFLGAFFALFLLYLFAILMTIRRVTTLRRRAFTTVRQSPWTAGRGR